MGGHPLRASKSPRLSGAIAISKDSGKGKTTTKNRQPRTSVSLSEPVQEIEAKNVLCFSQRLQRINPFGTRKKSGKRIAFCLPTWDIDNAPDKWKATIAVAKEIVDLLASEGVSRSVFLKWSGKGIHVHIHHKAFSPSLLLRIDPLDIAYAVVEYVNRQLRPRYSKIAERYQAGELNIQNEMDLQRVFTCPLSLHRSLNLVAVCFPTDAIESFTPEWANPQSYRHWNGWSRFKTGEADRLGEKAHKFLGFYSLKKSARSIKQREKATESITKWLGKE